MKKLLKVKIFGFVQGVFFRHSAKRKADELGLKGFVKNEDDGTVYAEAVGEEIALNEFLEWCQHGPPSAGVEKVEFSFDDTIAEFTAFEIK